jgi:uncharacterized membrane protein YkvA (DUF1232 family)
MLASFLVKLMAEANLSAEELGRLSGISGMTIRRWVEKGASPQAPIAEIYQSAIRESVFKLVIEGKLSSESAVAKEVFAGPGSLSQTAAIRALGFPEDLSVESQALGSSHLDKIISGLSHIGSLESRRDSVDRDQRKLPEYKKLGREWRERISVLIRVIQSKKLSRLDKFPAYGAFFYLFLTFDLIPDTIPVFGLMDDFAVLGIAATYYLSRQVKIER